MSRINPWGIPKPQKRQETRTLVDADSGFEVRLTLKQIDPIEMAEAVARTQEYEDLYGGDTGIPLILPATDFEPAEPRTLPQAFYSQVSLLQQMEVPEDGEEEPAGLLWWAGIATRLPNVFVQVGEWMTNLLTVSASASKNGQRTPGGSQSEAS